MNDIEEQFDIISESDEPENEFKIVHLHNGSDVYHLTRQVLLDSVLTQDTYCFFYHILTRSDNEFNNMYGSFACLLIRNIYEADLYLNVNSDALYYIIKYIQTNKINDDIIGCDDKICCELIDLAIMFGMSNLTAMLRNILFM